MADRLSAEARSRIMRAVRDKDTGPEMAVRKCLFREGYRYRLHVKTLPGTPDVVFPAKKRAIFINGCFWHQHGCASSRLPASNRTYWWPKLKHNQARDAENLKALRAAGWKCLVLWECQLNGTQRIRQRLLRFLG